MKYNIVLWLTTFSALLLSSCTSKEDDGEIGLDTSPNTFVANIEGDAWSAAKKEAIINGDFLTVYGEAANGSLMTLNIKLYQSDPTARPYILANYTEHYAAYDYTTRLDSLIFWSKNNSDVSGQSGDIVITKLDLENHLVSGTFKFRAYNNHSSAEYLNLSQGAFTDIQIVNYLSIDISGTGEIIIPEDSVDVTPPLTHYINCSFNQNAMVSTTTTISSDPSLLFIEGLYSAVSKINLQFPITLEIGSYSIHEPVNNISFSMIYNGVSYNLNPYGNLNITEKTNERISGNFEGTICQSSDSTNVADITNGVFSVSLLQ